VVILMTKFRNLRHNGSIPLGFTLVELAVVLTVIAVLSGSILLSVARQAEVDKIRTTQQQLHEIKQALLGYAVIYHRLPCAADPSLVTGAVGAGTETLNTQGNSDISDDTCNLYAGILPWVDLGVAETDAWGRRFTYRVTQKFAQYGGSCVHTAPDVYFALCDEGTLLVKDLAGGSNIASKLVAVVVSHGKNGHGANLPSGINIAFPPDPGAEPGKYDQEKENTATGGVGTEFVKTGFHAEHFDDVLAWLGTPVLMNRMVSAQKLP